MKKNARWFIKLHPPIIIVVKYYNYLNAYLNRRKQQLIIILLS